LLGFDMIQGSLWMDVRKVQDPKRKFGSAPTAAWNEFRQRVPLRQASSDSNAPSIALLASEFLKATPASTFYRGEAQPGAER
jgi:histidine ammonia-lyase